MESIVQFLSTHASQAHWFIFFGILLAGCNVPISIDVLVILAAVLSAKFVPEHTALLYASVLTGSLLSAWIAYSLGRTIGRKWTYLSNKTESMQAFYTKYGIWAFIVGRFIPFGVRNCLFMTSGLSKMPFLRFALKDFFGCFIWVTACFTVFFHIGQNFETIWHRVQTLNVLLFIAFFIAVISSIWYKRIKIKQANRTKKCRDP